MWFSGVIYHYHYHNYYFPSFRGLGDKVVLLGKSARCAIATDKVACSDQGWNHSTNLPSIAIQRFRKTVIMIMIMMHGV